MAQSELSRKQSDRLNGFLQTLLGSANPANGPGRDLKVIQVLDQASAQLDGEPALLAQAHQTVGQAYAGLKETTPALRHLRAALALDRQVYGEDHIMTARAKAALGTAILHLQRTDAEVEALLREAIAVPRRQPSEDQADLLQTLLAFDRLLYLSGKLEDADAQASEMCALAGKISGEESEPYADALQAVGMLHVNQGGYVGTETSLRQGMAICWRLPRPSPLLPEILAALAYDLLLQGRSDEPEGILREAMEIVRRTMGKDTTCIISTWLCWA